MNKINFSWLPEESRLNYIRVACSSLHAEKHGEYLSFMFYQGVISNFYKAKFVVDAALVARFASAPGSIVTIERNTWIHFNNALSLIMDRTSQRFLCTSGEQFIMCMKAAFCNDIAHLDKALVPDQDGMYYKGLGRRVRGFANRAAEWNKLRVMICYFIIYARYFEQPEFMRLCNLMKTVWQQSSDVLYVSVVEASPRDAIWGIGSNTDDAIDHLHANPRQYHNLAQQSVFTQAFNHFMNRILLKE